MPAIKLQWTSMFLIEVRVVHVSSSWGRHAAAHQLSSLNGWCVALILHLDEVLPIQNKYEASCTFLSYFRSKITLVQLPRSIRTLGAGAKARERKVGKEKKGPPKMGTSHLAWIAVVWMMTMLASSFLYGISTLYFKDCEQYFFKGSKALIYSKKLFLHKSWIIQLVPDGNFRLLFFAFHFCRIISLTVILPASGRSYVLLYSILACIIFKETGPQKIWSRAEQERAWSMFTCY